MQRVSQQSQDEDSIDDSEKQVDPIPRSLRDLERRHALKTFNNASIISSLRWLFNATSHRSVKYIIQQSIGALPFPTSREEDRDMQKCFFDEKDLQLTEMINVDLTEAEIDANLRMLRSYVTVRLCRTPRSGEYWARDVNEAIVCLIADIPVLLNRQRVELEDCLEKAFSDPDEPPSLPVCAWQQLYVANKRNNRIFKFLQGVNIAIRMYDEIYAKVKYSLAADNAWEVILHTLLDHNGAEVSPLTTITPKAFLYRAGIIFDTFHFGPEKRWVYTDRDHELGAPTRFLLDMNQYFVITLGAESASKLDESHLEGLWWMIRALVIHTSYAKDRAICAAIHKTLKMIIDTEGPDEGLQL
ncbi:hypothetical protein CYLTODRAFT_460557, partial [Cylindrobasidium torrendii FP15055 ss-10]